MSARTAGDAGLIEALRARRDKGKESISRDMFQDGRLTMKARGILGYLLSKPDKWRTNAAAISKECDRDGRESIANGLKELEELGYLARKRRQGAQGRWVWCWVYSDEPDEVSEVLAEMFPDGSAAAPDVRRGRARTPQLGGEAPGQTTNGKPVDGEGEVPAPAMNGFPVDGSPVDGSPVDGKPVDIEIPDQEIPPQPPASGGSGESSEEPQTCEHGKRSCRICGTSPRSQAQAERERAAAEAADAERAGHDCRVCSAHGKTADGATRWIVVLPGTQVPVTPYVACSHDRTYEEVLADIAEREAEQERAAAARQEPEPVASSAEVRAAAMAQVRKVCSSGRSASRARRDVAPEAAAGEGAEVPASEAQGSSGLVEDRRAS